MNSIEQIAKILDERCPKDGHSPTKVADLNIYRASKPTGFHSALYKPSLCVVIKGSKLVEMGGEIYTYDREKYIVSATHLPVSARVESCPYLSLVIAFEMEDILNVIREIGNEPQENTTKRGLFLGKMSERLAESIARLVFLALDDDGEFPARLAIKEILYILLRSESGAFLRQYAQTGTIENKITRAVTEIKNNFSSIINMDELAHKIDISPSSLYHNFKRVTALSPLQFQKKIRLEEAKYLLLTQNLDASSAAFAVGYESPSQFSREYSRMFGMPPRAHAAMLRDDK